MLMRIGVRSQVVESLRFWSAESDCLDASNAPFSDDSTSEVSGIFWAIGTSCAEAVDAISSIPIPLRKSIVTNVEINVNIFFIFIFNRSSVRPEMKLSFWPGITILFILQ